MSQNISATELHRRIESQEPIVVIDVRSPFEYRSGHIPGARNMPLSRFENEFQHPQSGETVVIVCQSGARSSHACQLAVGNQVPVLNLAGGTTGWIKAGFEIQKTKASCRNLNRQTHLVAGLLLVAALILHFAVAPNWIFLAALPTFGLLLDAITGICPMTLILRKMPWNAGYPECPGQRLTLGGTQTTV